jgi:hypothetical protein
MNPWRRANAGGLCRDCRFFEGRPLALEDRLPLIAALSSAHGSSRADDGLCLRHERFVAARASCGAYARRGEAQPIRQ